MKIISYNVNGIRAALTKQFTEWLQSENPDVLCLQETKAQPDQVDTLVFAELGYTTYLHSAEKKGYSGVAILCKESPDKVSTGMQHTGFDTEGRIIRADFGDITVVSVYVPSGSTGDIRQALKMEFLDAFALFIADLRTTRPNIVVCGDYNISHKDIDIHHPETHGKVSGFLPEERKWLDQYEASGMIDSFRVFDQRPEQYSWWNFIGAARSRNVGWRIDYHWVSEPLRERLQSAAILADAIHSDHCPVMVELK